MSLRSGAIPISSPGLPGRERELTWLERELANAAAGNTRFILLAGPTGVGKTRLLREAARRATAFQVRGLHLPPERVSPEDLIEDWLGPTLVPGARRGGTSTDLGLAAVAFPRLRDLYPVAGGPPSGAVPYSRAVAAVNRLLGEAADRHPLLFLIDDLPRLRPEVRALILDLAAGLSGSPVAFLATARREHPRRDRALGPLLDRHLLAAIDIDPLSESGLGELIAGELDRGIVASLLPWLWARSRGNPLFAVELIRSLEGQGLLHVDRTTGAWRIAMPIESERLPESIAHVLDSRRRALAAELGRALPFLALLGADVPDRAFAHALGISAEKAADLRARLHRAGILVRQGTGDAFAHPLMAEHWQAALAREARQRVAGNALDDLRADVAARPEALPGLRPGSCATGFEPASDEELARIRSHARAAGRARDAILACVEQGRRSLRAGRPREAVRWARRASARLAKIDAAVDPETERWIRGQIDYLTGSALHREGRFRPAEARLARFLTLPEAADPHYGTYAFIRLGKLLVHCGRSEEGRQVLENGIRVLEAVSTPVARMIRCDMHGDLAFIAAGAGAIAVAESHLAAAVQALGDLAGDPTCGSSRPPPCSITRRLWRSSAVICGRPPRISSV